jgi:hypothetical protein
MKVAMIVGHNEKSKGAFSSHLNTSEFDFYGNVIDRLFELYEDRFDVADKSFLQKKKEEVSIFRVPNTGYSKEMAEVVSTINNGKYDVAIELHFNAGGGTGSTVLYWHKSKQGKDLSDLFQNIMSKKTGIKKRDLIQIKDSSQNGAYGIMHSKCPYVLLEPFFGDSKDDCSRVSVDIIADVLFDYLNIITDVKFEDNALKDIQKLLAEANRKLEALIK